MTDQSLRSLISECLRYNAIKFGDFVLKTGVHSPIYLDIRSIVNSPEPLKLLSDLMYEKVVSAGVSFDRICGVPYTALPIASAICVKRDKFMVSKRKEAKDYGTKQLIEGIYKTGERILIIEDIISSGSSILETALALRSAGLVVTDAVVFIDRQQKGITNMKEHGINVHSLVNVETVLKFLEKDNKVLKWIASNPLTINDDIINESKLLSLANNHTKVLSYEERSELSSHPLTKRLFALMAEKKSNLCVALDLTESAAILRIAKEIGRSIVVLKLHIDIVSDLDTSGLNSFFDDLKDIATKERFLIFEDRKYADIGNTVKLQYTEGLYRVSSWADIVNAHLAPGPGVVEGLRAGISQNGDNQSNRGCLLVAQMSSEGNLLNATYSKTAYKWAKKYSDFVIGFISQSRVSADQTFIHMTPGVRLDSIGDGLGQQYITPEEAVLKRGADIVIVGRGVANASDARTAAELYRNKSFEAYLNRNNV